MRIHGSIQQLLFAFYIRNAFSPLAYHSKKPLNSGVNSALADESLCV